MSLATASLRLRLLATDEDERLGDGAAAELGLLAKEDEASSVSLCVGPQVDEASDSLTRSLVVAFLLFLLGVFV